MSKNKRRKKRNKGDAEFIFLASQAVLALLLCLLFFISGAVLKNGELKNSLSGLVKGENEGLETKIKLPKDILGEAIFSKSAASPVPLEGNITSYFGKRVNPILKRTEFHKGLDIKAPLYERVGAAYFGKCEKTGENPIDGKYVILTHGNFKTKYCHLSKIFAEEGMTLREGEALGETGATGLATGSHLHLEIIKDGKYIDPLSAFKRI